MSDWVEEYHKGQEQEGQKGGPGSGHHGHAGRPGKRGGSVPGKGGGSAPAVTGQIQAGIEQYQRRYGEDQPQARIARDKNGEEVLLVAKHIKGTPSVKAFRDDGRHVGTMYFNYSQRGKTLLVWRQTVADDEQRKGIATLMARRALERWPGYSIATDPLSPLSGEGQAFWESLTSTESQEIE